MSKDEKVKHTPGPWHVDADSSPIEMQVSSEDFTIAACGRIDSPVAEANAYLIAAAPDLLEALKAIKELLGKESRYSVIPNDGGTIDMPEAIRIGNIFERGSAAISKATGQAEKVSA